MSNPIPTRLTKANIHTFAENLAVSLEFSRRDSIESLVIQLGGRIEYKTADISANKLPESIVVRSFNDFTIFLPSVTSAMRDRFTIAHELGHLFLHYPLVSECSANGGMVATRWVDETKEDLKRAEWEANWFAAAFLMPSHEFKKVFDKNLQNIEMTALEFKVSPKATQVRAHSLGLI